MDEMEKQPEMNEEQPAAEAADATGKKGRKKAGEKEKKTVGQEILSWVLTILVAVAAALLIRSLIFEPVRVDGHSMDDTLADGEIMFVSKFDFSTTYLSLPWQSAEAQENAPRFTLGGNPARFDVVICHYPGRGGTNFVKRVVGLPGDRISFTNGVLSVNGEEQEESYINDAYRSGSSNEMKEFRVPARGDVLMISEGYLKVNDEYWPFLQGRISGKSADGQTMTYDQGALLLDGQEISSAEDASGLEGKAFILQQDYLFVCGDHRNNSNDSRYVGPVSRDMIIGHVRQVLFPFSGWRSVQ